MATFVTREEGAVTADWVIMSAALVGLGIAVISTLISGLDRQSGQIAGTMSGINVLGATQTETLTEDFTSGVGNWIGGELQTIRGFGSLLALSGRNPKAEFSFDAGANAAYAVLEFDMVIGDSWDNEALNLTLDGQNLLSGTHRWRGGEPQLEIGQGPAATNVTLTRASTQTGSTNWASAQDYVYRVRVVAPNTGVPMTLVASTTLNQRAQDEFLGIDNVVVSGTGTP